MSNIDPYRTEEESAVEDEEVDMSFLPPFARGTENEELYVANAKLERKLEQTERALEQNMDRLHIMDEHLKNVEQELKYTQTRVETKNKEIESEKHLNSMAEREAGRVKKDKSKMAAERTELADKINGLQNQIYKHNEKLDQFKMLMNWNQEELEQWALAERQKVEDNTALEKYRHADDAKVKELTLVLERVSKQVVQRKDDLELEVVETQAAQIQLDKAAEDFRRLHVERQDLIRQWEEAVEAMRHRDGAIAAASEQFTMQKVVLRERKRELDAQARFLENEMLNNKEADARVAYYEREVAKQRDLLTREQARQEELTNQVELVKATLSKAATELSQRTVENKQAREDLDHKRRKLDTGRKRYAVLKRKLETEFGNLDSMEAKAAALEAMRKGEEVRLKAVIKEHELLKKEQYKRSQVLFELRSKERELISEISGGQGQNKNLAARIHALDEQVVRQQELLYNVEFQLQQMERKVARAGGMRSEEETRALNTRIEKLTSILEGINQEHSMLLEQVKRAEDDLLAARRSNTALRGDKGKLDEALSTLKLENDMVHRQVKAAVDTREEALVNHDVMALEVKRLRDILNAHADEVFSLENRKAQLALSMEERKQEVAVHRDGLRAELRLLREDVHRITLELKERLLRCEKLQAKFEILSSKHRGAAEEDGEEWSQAYFVIKAAQEREALQREGDDLDSRIRVAEKEVAALEATVAQLMACNTNFAQSHKKVSSKEAFEERSSLREKLDKAYDKLKTRRADEAAIVGDIQVSESRLSNLVHEQRSLMALVDDMNRRKSEAVRQLDEQREKLQRALTRTDKLRNKLGIAHMLQAQDIELAEARDVTRAMLLELKALAASNPAAGILAACESAGIRLAAGGSMPASLSGSRPASARSQGSSGSARSGRSGAGSHVGHSTGAERPGRL
ncbi:Coiled-coil domain-containing protein 39 [Tetrabaena socialis]|uniref:Coiled-coil domain-containing protein 39 n=1 Tax=Tetrabaena socialis TaxID=47790 RepID=A0A2J7ZR94_9CHLO|nr:Coiled-coil domain-containing protein 39 [Tetrabaena socialis]|eukprot:PNH02795.1 Coiled-coil domain-containing protein 39 [Tetrabaena socialis]